MLNDILILDQQWLPNQSDFPPISWHWYRAWPSPIMSGFHGAFGTGVACQQGTLTLADTWFRPPLWDLLVLQLLRPDSSNLPCLYSPFHLEYSLVLSRFCFTCMAIGPWGTRSKRELQNGKLCLNWDKFDPTIFGLRFRYGNHCTTDLIWWFWNAYSSGHMFPSLFCDVCLCLNCWDQFSRTLPRLLSTFHLEYPSTLLELLCSKQVNDMHIYLAMCIWTKVNTMQIN